MRFPRWAETDFMGQSQASVTLADNSGTDFDMRQYRRMSDTVAYRVYALAQLPDMEFDPALLGALSVSWRTNNVLMPGLIDEPMTSLLPENLTGAYRGVLFEHYLPPNSSHEIIVEWDSSLFSMNPTNEVRFWFFVQTGQG